jgi:hypothetical protein
MCPTLQLSHGDVLGVVAVWVVRVGGPESFRDWYQHLGGRTPALDIRKLGMSESSGCQKARDLQRIGVPPMVSREFFYPSSSFTSADTLVGCCRSPKKYPPRPSLKEALMGRRYRVLRRLTSG